MDKRGQEGSCMFIYDMLSGIPIGLLHKIANDVYLYFRECSLEPILFAKNEFFNMLQLDSSIL